jgi:hypothetical protein
MTPVQKARLKGTNASLAKRGVSVTLQPGAKITTAIVEHVDENTKKRLQVLDANVTHILHIKRDDITTLGVDIKTVSEIERGDSAQTYRVEDFTDDPQRLVILFHCASA